MLNVILETCAGTLTQGLIYAIYPMASSSPIRSWISPT